VEKLVRDASLDIIVANLGANADQIVIRAEAVRAQHEGEEIGRRTKSALAAAKARGVQLGNRVNLVDAQRKGAQANRTAAQIRHGEFLNAVAEARQLGACTAKEIATKLDQMGFKPARGGAWTPGGVYQALRAQNAPHKPTKV
jgi:DNA invertase Pin-like site-specific DNA recombinase